jgi:uncharacterized DUF497 family protein
MQISGFDWDDGNWPKCARHGVSKEEIESLFETQPGIYADPHHSIEEQRLRAIGRTASGRMILVAFAIRQTRDETHIRPISARYMHQKEIRRYDLDT